MLKGERLTLRPVKRSDISCFLKWFNDPEVVQYLGLYLPMTEMAEEKWIEDLPGRASTDLILVIELPGEAPVTPIGNLGLHRMDHKNQAAMVGIVIGEKDCWGKGYGTEATRLLINYAFKELNLNRITSHVYEFNERSIKMHKKVGFQEEGRMRQAVFKNGMFWDEIVFGILRDEWQ